jgi:hypothetical protein
LTMTNMRIAEMKTRRKLRLYASITIVEVSINVRQNRAGERRVQRQGLDFLTVNSTYLEFDAPDRVR